jgi:predicted porin
MRCKNICASSANIASITLAIGLSHLGGHALAQSAPASTVNLYGVVDNGVSYVNNINGGAATLLSSGVFTGSRFGIKGSEDLGGQLKAIFLLENGFTIDNGVMSQGSAGVSRVFGRQAYVGMGSAWGTLTFGRQYDFMIEQGYYASAGYVSSLSLRPGTGLQVTGNNGSTPDFDRVGGGRVDNAIRYTSPQLGGVTFGLLYGLGEKAGDYRSGSTVSGVLRYTGAKFGAGVSVTDRSDGIGHYRNVGAGMSYELEKFFFTADYTNTHYTVTGDNVDVLDVGVKRQIGSPATTLGIAYVYMRPNNGVQNTILPGIRSQYVICLDYNMSKRTDVYAVAAYQHSNARVGAQTFSFSPTDGTASGQFIAHVGIRHFF